MLRSSLARTAAVVPKAVMATPTSAHSIVAIRYNSNASGADGRHTPEDGLLNILKSSINSPVTGALPNEQFRMARGNYRKGDIYKPSDLNDSGPTKFDAPPKPVDELKILKLNPVVEYKNAALLSHYVSPLGRILSREQTGLSAKNQRRVTKAIRRARAMCIISPTAKAL
ncbi:small subunit ribosomal protein S18 [Entomortierella parvispora]|uniref:Small ribosomal subunit protein bS18m n=1 Tax=Entomortierella parvispora TaxID=205924 RepID=A0A9P3H5Y5_9FUNG|nr:small subunit ribosomal protein S18 [Entomortierella parvispora]